MKLVKIHGGVKFKVKEFMKNYIDKNIELRKQAKNKFEGDVFKLMNNAVFGKTMENVENRINVKLVTSEKKALIWLLR